VVHRRVQFAQSDDARGVFLRVVETIVGLGKALVVGDHQGGTRLVILLARRLQGPVRLPSGGEWEVSVANVGHISGIVFQC